MNRQERMIRSAYSEASTAHGVFLVGAVIAKGGRIIATGQVEKKTHPRNPKLLTGSKRKQLCAEIKALFRALKILRPDELKKCSLYVARKVRNSRNPAMAKPCIHCQAVFKEVGIKEIFFTDEVGEIKRLML